MGGGVCEWILFGKNLRSFLAEAFRDIISNRPIPICSVILYYCGPDVKVSHHDFTYYGQHIGRDISLDAEGKRRINIVIFLYLPNYIEEKILESQGKPRRSDGGNVYLTG